MTPASPDRETAATVDEAAPAEVRFPGLRLEGRLGGGGGGVVYRAVELASGRRVALKLLRAGAWGSEAQRARFRREIETHRRLGDPGVVRIFADGTTPDGAPWFTMELVEGPSLQGRIDAGDLPPLADRVAWVRDVARTLARLHARGVVHRDIKPSNILLQGGSEALLADFGVVLVADEERLTVGPRAIGTPRYMAPEQLAGAVDDWRRVDVYALGLVLAELLGPGPRPADLAYVVARATAVAPAERHPSAAQLAEELDRWLAGKRARTRAAALVWRLRRRTTALRLIAATLAVALVAIFAVVRVQAARRDARADADWEVARAGLQRSWSAADARAADDWVSRFASDPARQRTPAAGRAWLELAALHRDAERRDDQAAALGRALAATDDVAVRAAAVAEVVADHRRARRWPALAHLLRALPAEGIDLDPELRRRVEADLALAAGDIAAAAALLPEHAALLAPFQALRGAPPGTYGALDSDGDGELEPVIGENSTRALTRERDEHGRLVWRFGSRHVHFTVLRSDGPRALLQTSEALWSLSAAGPERVGPPTRTFVRVGERVFAATTAARRTLAELSAGAATPADPATDRLSAFVQGAGVGDIDGDEQPDLVVGFGPAMGFLLRAFRVDPDGGPLRELASVRPGDVGDVQVLTTPAGPRIAALMLRQQPSTPLFGPDEPYGLPAGVRTWRHVAASDGAPALAPVAAYDIPPGTPGVDHLFAADLDGDGASELLVTLLAEPDPTVLVLRHDHDTLALAFALHGYEISSVVRHAGRDVPLLTRRETPQAPAARWFVGVGDESLPRRALDEVVVDPGADPTVRLFSAVALDRSAAESAAQHGDAARAARFWERAGEPLQAARALAEATHGPDAAAALAHAVDLAIDGADATLARGLVDRLTALAPDRGAAKAAEVAAYLAPAWSLDLARPLPVEVQVGMPPALRHDLTNRELTVRAPVNIDEILRIPLRATGGPAWLHVAGAWTRSEWGCVAEIGIYRPVDIGLPLRLRFAATGAGGMLFRKLEALGAQRVARPDVATQFDLRAATLRAGAGVQLHGSHGDARYDYAENVPVPHAGEVWELRIRSTPATTATSPMCELVLRQLEFGGFVALTEPAPPTAAAVAWAAGEGPPPPGEPADDVLMAALLRLDPSLRDRVRDTYGPEAANRLFHVAWFPIAEYHHNDGRIIDAMLGMGDTSGVAAQDRLWLLSARGKALVRSGQPAAARTLLTAVWRDAAGFEDQAWRPAFEAAALLAELDLSAGDTAGAAVWMDRAAALAPDPDVGARLLRHRPGLAAATTR